MIVLELDEVEVDYCPNCRGVWLDAGELELVIDKTGGQAATLGDVLQAEGDAPADAPRRCPRCRRRMRQPNLEGGGEPVTVDVCPRGHGVWLDDGELRALVHAAGGSAAVRALSDYFGHLFGEGS
jgi:hypothetical protein